MSHDVFLLEPQLSPRVQSAIVDRVVVPLRKNANLFIWELLYRCHSMHDWDCLILQLINDDVTWDDLLTANEEQNVSSVVRRLHGTTSGRRLTNHDRAYLRTTTTGLSVLVTTINVFHIMRAEHTIMPKLRPCKRSYRRMWFNGGNRVYFSDTHFADLIQRVSDYVHLINYSISIT